MTRSIRLCAACVLISVSASVALAGRNWPNWRGPDHNGAADEKNLPASWSATKNIVWRTSIPETSGSTPIIWGDRIFLSGSDAKARKSVAICLDTATGKVLWRKDLGKDADVRRRNNMTSASPVTDGERVVFLTGRGQLTAFDFEGKQLWTRSIIAQGGLPSIMWGYSSSPLMHGGKVYVQVLQNHNGRRYSYMLGGRSQVDSYLMAVNPADGKTLWAQRRMTDARDESQESYATPVPRTTKDGEEILVMGADYVTGHDAETGKELWRWKGYNTSMSAVYRIVPSPVACGGLVVICAPKKEPVYAFRPGGKMAWKLGDDCSSDVCTPLVYQGRLYVLNGEKKVLNCIDPAAGKVKWTASLGGNIFRASPTGADGKIYCMDVQGRVSVLQAGDQRKGLAQFDLKEGPSFSTIVAVDGKLYVRTAKALTCVAAGGKGG
jgi:outer membrane protein assembly factor BamB